MYGILASSQVESENAAVDEMRSCVDTTYGCIRFIEYSQEIFGSSKKAAIEKLTIATPRAIVYLAEVEAQAESYRLQWIDEALGISRIYVGDGHAHFVATISDEGSSCTCGVPIKDKRPCACLARLARAVTRICPLESLILHHDHRTLACAVRSWR